MFSRPSGWVVKLKADVPWTPRRTKKKQTSLVAAKTARALSKFPAFVTSNAAQCRCASAGSGTSSGLSRKAFDGRCGYFSRECQPGTGAAGRTVSPAAAKVITEIGYDNAAEKENIEASLSRCEAYLQVKTSADVTTFITASKKAGFWKSALSLLTQLIQANSQSIALSFTGFRRHRVRCGFLAEAIHDKLRSLF
jgi:hypothetical protein